VIEEKCGTGLGQRPAVDLGQLEHGGDGLGDAPEPAALIEVAQEGAQIPEWRQIADDSRSPKLDAPLFLSG
jgi:hypothetical protein